MNNIAIVGCGPAGLSAAIALHDAGQKITLYEQFDQPAPVGSGLMLQPTGLRVLERFGLRAQAESLGQRIDGMLGRVAPNGKVVLDINYRVLSNKLDGELYGVAIHRAALFDILYKAVQTRSIDIVTGKSITGTVYHGVNQDSDNKCTSQLLDSDGSLIENQFDLVVDASGSRSKLAQHSGLLKKPKMLDYGALWATVELNDSSFDKTLLEQRYKRASVMVGVLPCGQIPDQDQPLATLFWSIRGDEYESFRAAGLDSWKKQVVNHWPAVAGLLENIKTIDQLTHAVYTHHTLKQPHAPGIVFIGDAAHATSPQLGQGANMAFLDALALSEAMSCANEHEDYALLYAKSRQLHVRLFQAASYLLTPFYQSDSRLLPALRDSLFEPVSKLPLSDKIVTALGSGLISNPVRTIDNKVSRARRATKKRV